MANYTKKKSATKNQTSLKHEVAQRDIKIQNKYSVLKDVKDKQGNKIKTLEDLYENVMKILNVIAKEDRIVLDGEYKTEYYIKQKKYDNNRKPDEDKQLTNVEKLYKDMGDGLFKRVTTANTQTPKDFMDNQLAILDDVNYSVNSTNANMTYQSVKESIENASKKIVAYDLETLGGTSSKTGIWRPIAITEFSFQTLDLENYKGSGDITKHINYSTAVIGMEESTGKDLLRRIEATLTSKGTIDDEELRVTAKRLQLYGKAEFVPGSDGITTVTKFPGDEAYIGGYNIEDIKKGINELVNARKHAEKFKTTSGLLPYHKKMFEELATIQNENLTVLDFNGMMFDQPVMNGILNSILKNEYGNNKDVLNEVTSMFNNGTIKFDPTNRVDAMGIFKEAGKIAGIQKVYGANGTAIEKSVSKTRAYRQEILMEAFQPKLMDGMERHIAELDTTNVLRAVYEKLDTFGGKSAFDNAWEIVSDKHKNQENLKLTKDNINNYIFKAKTDFQPSGRSVLDFSTNVDGTIRTRSNFIIGGNSEFMKANKGVLDAGWNTGGAATKGGHYKIGGMYEVTLDEKELAALTDLAPEYANKTLYALRMDTYFGNDANKENFKEYDSSTVRFFTSKSQLEAALSNNFEHAATIQDELTEVITNREEVMVRQRKENKVGTVKKKVPAKVKKSLLPEGVTYSDDDEKIAFDPDAYRGGWIKAKGKNLKEKTNNKRLVRRLKKEGYLDKQIATHQELVERGLISEKAPGGIYLFRPKMVDTELDIIEEEEYWIKKEMDVEKKITSKSAPELINREDYIYDKEEAKKLTDNQLLNNKIAEFYKEKAEEKAKRHFDTKMVKRSEDFVELEKDIQGLIEEGVEESKDIANNFVDNKAGILKGHLEIAQEVSSAIARGEDITKGKQRIHDIVVNRLGYKDKKTNTQNLFSNTLNNYARNAEKYSDIAPVVSMLKKATGTSGVIAEKKVDYILNSLMHDFAMQDLGEDYINLLRKEKQMTSGELKNTFRLDIGSFKDERVNKYDISNINNTFDDKDILTVNLNSSPQALAKKVRGLRFGDNKNAETDTHLSIAMIDFVNYLEKTDKRLFKNKTLKTLKNNIDSKELLNSTIIAETVIKGLNEIKEKNVNYDKHLAPIVKTDLLDIEDFRKKFSNYILNDVSATDKIASAIKKAPKVSDIVDLDGIVDRYFMPTARDGKKSLTGSNALKFIIDNNQHLQSDVDKDIFKTHWNMIRDTHKQNLEAISNLIINTDGEMVIQNGQIYAKYNDQLIEFKNLTKTKFEYGSLRHQVGNTAIMAHMNVSAEDTGGNIRFGLDSNLSTITKAIKENKSKIERASKQGDLTSEMISIFSGSISNEMRKNSVIQSNNVHELAGQNKIGFGHAFGEILPKLVGDDKTPGYLEGSEVFDARAIEIVKKELAMLKDNYKGDMTPQMKEAMAKNLIPILRSNNPDLRVSHKLLSLTDYMSLSTKDNDVGGKDGMYFLLSSDRYTQRSNDSFDAPKRPTLQAGKIDFNKEDLETGLQSYLASDGNNKKFGKVGSIFSDIKAQRETGGVGIKEIESAVTIKKANVGNVGLQAAFEDHIVRVEKSKSVEANVKRATRQTIAALNNKVSLQEQEKIMDSRLVDSTFEYAANIQHIRNKDINEFYLNKFDPSVLTRLADPKIPNAEREALSQEAEIIRSVSNSAINISLGEDGKFNVQTPDGKIVKRGDKVLSFYDKHNTAGKVASKIGLGRFQHGVFEKKGNIRLKDSAISDFLNENLEIIEGESNEDLTRRAYSLLDDKFKMNFFISDIRQSTYTKFMDDAVEKDMTYTLHSQLGEYDKKIAKTLSLFKYGGKSGDIFKGQVLRASELELIFKDFDEFANKELSNIDGVYKTKESLMEAIYTERHKLSDFLFREMDIFKDVSVISNHQTSKHKNYGMIADNIIGSIYESFEKQDKSNAMSKLQNVLAKYDVFDANTMELKSDGTGIYIKPKDGKSSHTRYDYSGTNILEDVRYLRVGGIDKDGNEIGLKGLIKNEAKHLYNENVNYYNSATNKIEKITTFGEIEKLEVFTYKDSDGITRTANNVAIMSKGISVLQQAVDPETMTVYDAEILRGLGIKRNAEKVMIDARLEMNKYKKQIEAAGGIDNMDSKEYDSIVTKAKEIMKIAKEESNTLMQEANNILAGYEEHASPKRIGKQEFGIYSRVKFNYSTSNVANEFLNPEDKTNLEFREKYIADNMSSVLEKTEAGYIVKEKAMNRNAYKKYTDDLIATKIFNEKTDIELTDDMLELDEYKHLRNIKETIKDKAKLVNQDKVSIRYAEDMYQGRSAVYASEFNNSPGSISIKQMEDLGFNVASINDFSHIGINDTVSSFGMAGDINLNTVFNQNTLLYIGGDKDNASSYVAMPKSGKVLKDTEVTRMFQSHFKHLESLQNEYYEGNFLGGEDSKKHDQLVKGIENAAQNIKDSIDKYTYNKEGILHSLSTVEADEAFRLKFSFVNNTQNLENIGNKGLQADIIQEADNHLLKKAKVNGVSLIELEKNKIYTDYAFISEDIFKDLGYFSENKLNKIKGNTDMTNDEAIAIMRERLQTDGILVNTGRYPTIMQDSDKATRVYLGEGVDRNRARVSVVTALSMNADNDGDSASFNTLKLKDGTDYLDYKLAVDNAKDLAPEKRAEAINKAMGGESNAQFFADMEARMAYASIGTNRYYNDASMDDIHSEVTKSINNGTISDDLTVIQNKHLFNEIMYANHGQMESTEVMNRNKDKLDYYVKKAQDANERYNLGVEGLGDMTPIDTNEILAKTKNVKSSAEYYDTHLEILSKLTKEQVTEMGMGGNAIQDFRQNAVARTMWLESLEEAQSKSRKGSIGPINVLLQGIRAGADELYNNSKEDSSYIRNHIVNNVALDLEQEVISAKHGSVISNIDKATQLKTLTNSFIKHSTDENKQGLLDFLNGTGNATAQNLSDKSVSNIWDKMETGGIVNIDNLKSKGKYDLSTDSSILAAKRDFLTDNYVKALQEIGSTPKAKKAMNRNRIGGTGASYKDLNAPSTIDSAGDMMASIIRSQQHSNANNKKEAMPDASPMIHFTDMIDNTNVSGLVSGAGELFKGKGLAMGALSIAAGVLASGYAGNPISQAGASELAQQEEVDRTSSNGVPVFLDQGAEVTRSSNKGYIINMKANSNRDIRNTKKAIRTAAAESAGGGVNVNMTIKDRRELSNDNIEQWITGL